MTGPDHPVIGIRSWVADDDGSLRGLVKYAEAWHPGVNVARCAKSWLWRPLDHKHTPAHGCSCGLYAFHEERIARLTWEYANMVHGLIRGWGRVESHPDGWRAEKAEIMALIDPSVTHPHYGMFGMDIKSIAKKYGVLVLPYTTELQTVVSEFGTFMPHELRPEKSGRIMPDTPVVADYLLRGSVALVGASIIGAKARALHRRHNQS